VTLEPVKVGSLVYDREAILRWAQTKQAPRDPTGGGVITEQEVLAAGLEVGLLAELQVEVEKMWRN
tara:strand:- start:376 stop:573 length:198 start_codon:yes stop_codon:yes gene_type:complete